MCVSRGVCVARVTLRHHTDISQSLTDTRVMTTNLQVAACGSHGRAARRRPRRATNRPAQTERAEHTLPLRSPPRRRTTHTAGGGPTRHGSVLLPAHICLHDIRRAQQHGAHRPAQVWVLTTARPCSFHASVKLRFRERVDSSAGVCGAEGDGRPREEMAKWVPLWDPVNGDLYLAP